MNEKNKTNVILDGYSVIIIRKFNAPKNIVFNMWSKKEHLEKWWGPNTFGCECEIDFRVGGKYQITMISKEGDRFPLQGEYLEIDIPNKIVYTVDVSNHPDSWKEMIYQQIGNKTENLENIVTIQFEDNEENTNVIIDTKFKSKLVSKTFYNSGMGEGWSQMLDKLNNLM